MGIWYKVQVKCPLNIVVSAECRVGRKGVIPRGQGIRGDGEACRDQVAIDKQRTDERTDDCQCRPQEYSAALGDTSGAETFRFDATRAVSLADVRKDLVSAHGSGF